jgi:hypothetical protein
MLVLVVDHPLGKGLDKSGVSVVVGLGYISVRWTLRGRDLALTEGCKLADLGSFARR